MADKLQIGGGYGTAKTRHPVAVAALAFVTVGIYFLYWWYQVNREMVDLGRARRTDGLGDNPWLSLLAMFPGGLVIIPPFFSLYNGVQRMKRAQEVTLGEASLNGWIVVALYGASLIVGVTGLIVPAYLQDELNKVWKAVGQPAGTPPEAPPQPGPAAAGGLELGPEPNQPRSTASSSAARGRPVRPRGRLPPRACA